MASWCADHLRDTNAWSLEGLPLSVNSDEAAKMFDSAVRQLVSWTDCEQLGGISGTMERMMNAEPEFLMGRVFSLGLDAIGTGKSVRRHPSYKAELDVLLADSANLGTIREQRHAKAVHFFANGWD
uniref:Amidohydrolase n=1 Tax=Globodera pallida TaxID=36090 RepID=A0A183C2N4_GLOPA